MVVTVFPESRLFFVVSAPTTPAVWNTDRPRHTTKNGIILFIPWVNVSKIIIFWASGILSYCTYFYRVDLGIWYIAEEMHQIKNNLTNYNQCL
jgi:hypothetical protein